MAYVDNCLTAQDVWQKARAVQRKRNASVMPVIKADPIEEIPPPRITEIAFYKGRWVGNYRLLMMAAYPRYYPGAPIFTNSTEKQHPTVAAIIDHIAHKWKLRRADLLADRRTHDMLIPRQIGMALARRITPCSTTHIGRQFGGRDHTTVLNADQKFAPLMDAVQAQVGEGATLEQWISAAFELSKTIKPALIGRVQRDA